MQRFILRRILQSVLLLFVLALVIFAMARVSGANHAVNLSMVKADSK